MTTKSAIVLFSSAILLGYTTFSNAAPRTYPGMTITSPAGFGMSRGSASVGVGATSKAVGNTKIGAAATGSIGFGDSRSLGAQLDVVIASLEPKGFADDGYFSFKVHKTNQSGLAAVSLGHEGIGQWGAVRNSGTSTYLAATKVVPLSGSKAVAFSGGIGDGRFATGNKAGVFASVAYLPRQNISLIADYTADRLNAGLSFVPSANLPLAVSVYAADVTKKSGKTLAGLSLTYGFNF